jgi:HD-like signal output (HDOD) protein
MANAATTSTGRPRDAAPADRNPIATPHDREAALQFLQTLATELSGGTVNLPCFPDVVVHIRIALADPEARLTETVRIAGAEPRLAARLLQAANSAVLNHSGKPMTDLRAAITRLGPSAVQSAAMAFAVQQVRLAPALRSIAAPLQLLWEESIAVASIGQVIARRTHISPDQAFLTGLLHGIGRLYIMIRAVGKSASLYGDQSLMDMVDSWHASIGKTVLENWGFAEAMAEAVGLQGDYEHGRKHVPDLTDVLIAAVVLAATLKEPEPRAVDMIGIHAFHRLGLTPEDCAAILKHAEYQLGSLYEVLGC